MSRTPWFTLLVACAAVAGCSKHEDASNDTGALPEHSATEESSFEGDGGDPCSLLEPREVEAAIGKLAVPPYREGMNGPEATGGKCVYLTQDFRRLVLDVTWTDGASVMKMLGMPAAIADQAKMRGKLPLPDGVTLTGEWDEAKALSCCEIDALRGDAVVGINFMGTDLSTAQGTELLNAALRRLEAPLKIVAGAAGVAAAAQREESRAGRPKPVPACTLITAADAAALIGPVDTLPEDNEQKCEYRSKTQPKLISFSVSWERGYQNFRSDRDLGNKVVSGLLGGDAKAPEATAAAAAAAQYPGPWEKADVVVLDFAAVRGDVLMKIDIRGTSLDNAKALLATAMNRIAWPPKAP
ncbi:MAG: hypothetical protein ABI769_09035 [Pseudomonadota bacterium]